MPDQQFPLSSAQLSIWFAQQIVPNVPFVIAYYTDLVGPVRRDLLISCCSAAHREYGSTTVRIVGTADAPRQTIDDDAPDDVGTVDFRDHHDPPAAAAAWMREDCAKPLSVECFPLVRSVILLIADDRCYWYTKAHHIALDGFGATTILRRAAQLYVAAVAGSERPPDRSLGVDTLVAEDTAYRSSNRCLRDRDYWSAASSELSAPLSLSGRTAPPAAPLHVGGTLGPDTTAWLTDSDREPLSAVVIAAFAAYYARMTDQDDVVLSLPVSARTTARLRQAAGTVSNVVPLRLDGIGSATIDGAVAIVRTALSGVLRHQRFRPDTADTGAATNRMETGGFGPVVNIMMFDRTVSLGPLTGSVHVLTTGPTSDIALDIYPGTADLLPDIDFEANPALYARADVVEHHRRFLAFLDLVADPANRDLAVADVELTGSPGSAAVGAVPGEDLTLADLLTTTARTQPDAVAVCDGDVELTYRDLDRRSDELAYQLICRGIQAGSFVPVSIQRSTQSVIALWAVAKTGAAYVPIDPRLPPERVHYIVDDCRAEVGVAMDGRTLPATVEWLSVPERTVPECTVPELTAARNDVDLPAVHLLDAAYVIYTSGSTGTPKGVVVTHAGLGALATEIVERYQLCEDSRVLHFASPGFDTALVEVFAASLSGGVLVIAAPDVYGGSELTRLLARERVTHLLATPSALETVDPAALRQLRFVVMGGEVAPQSLVDNWIGGRTVRNAYGPSETTCSVTMTAPLTVGEQVSIGTPMPGVTALVLDRRLRLVPAGATGELYLATAGLARGYLDKYGWTATGFVANPFGSAGDRMFRSGDRARWNTNGTLEFLGRTDDQVKLRGFRIELGEIDAALRKDPDVAFAVTVVNTSMPESQLASYVVARGDASIDTGALRARVAQTLPHYMVPRSVTVIDTVPLTTNRKLDRSALPDPQFDHPAGIFVEPATPAEVEIAQIFGAVLGRDRVDARASFFDLGGDSLSATRAAGRIRARFPVHVGVRDVVDTPTVVGLAAKVESLAATAPARRPIVDAARNHEFVPLAPAQRYIDRSTDTAHYNLPFVLTLSGPLDLEALRCAIADLIERHRTLRSIYPDTDGRPQQRVLPTPETLVSVARVARSELAERIDAFLRAGFDVRTERPIRFEFFESDRHELIVACVVHHIAADGWSLGVLARDLLQAYGSRAAGSAPRWTALPIEFADYSVWRTDDDAGRDIDFWTTELAGAPAELHLPVDRPRPEIWSFEGGRVSCVLDTATIEAVAAAAAVGTFTVLRAALIWLLAEISGETDIVTGTPVAGRGDPLLDDVVGMFVNTLAVRTNIEGVQSLSDVITRARDSEIRALDHAGVQFEQLVEVLDPRRSQSLHPFFQVAMSFDTFVPTSLAVGDLTMTITPKPLDIAKCDLHFYFTENHDAAGKSTKLDVVYASAMFDEKTVDNIVERYRTIVLAIADGAPLSPPPATAAPDHARIVRGTASDRGPERGRPGD
ncbi:non-ribosomal peptide synthetase [Antrihabitans cavernicola]|uniref:Amino acid adenylation domain-containing protein n=1 Tax=Antrihabitans cavernicola TaxID=2495913 RepID=A0A5A7S859_9NOCA|nr:non-ribosomal peptide synthetase [Spelaeibacter cavernicola]KAA0022106.1 amino acid adenylation domain-containing protein [Spelaeibacter cavernicola]